MHGAARLAFLKISRSALSDSPSHFEYSCGPSMAMSGTPFSPESARAMAVFPVPDGPVNRMPRGGGSPTRSQVSPLLGEGSYTAPSHRFISSGPPTDAQSD